MDGVLINDQSFTHPMVIMNLPGNHPMATPHNSMEIAWANGTPTAQQIRELAQNITNALYINKKQTEKL